MTADPAIAAALPRCGDVVLHRPSGEEWLVAWAEGDDLAWSGWPDGIARLSDCQIVKRCSDDEHQSAVDRWAGVQDPRAGRVKRLYGERAARGGE